ncbi:MAG: RsmB/NOP family class I SAM-dependent RNA methyltransferase [Planctomycetota bacterium]
MVHSGTGADHDEPVWTSPWQGPKLPHLLHLWKQYLGADGLPQLDKWLSHALREHREFGKRDRLAYGDALFDIARFGGAAIILEQALAANTDGEGVARLRETAWPVDETAWKTALRNISPAVLFTWINICAGRMDEIGEAGNDRIAWWNKVRGTVPGNMVQTIWAGIPPFMDAAFEARARRSGWTADNGTQFLSRIHTRPPLWLRLIKPEHWPEIQKELIAAVFQVVRDGDGDAVSVKGVKSFHTVDAYQKGWVEVQDRASQAIVDMVPLTPGQFVWDACTGAGGKAVALAARLKNTGAVYASDVRGWKLEDLRKRAKRAELNNIRTFTADATAPQDWGVQIHKHGGFDHVLVDAPCTGTGTWRRNPDSRWRMTPAFMSEMTALQERLIDAGAKAVRGGGTLLYATCSWLVDENEAIVDKFLARTPGWTIENMSMHGAPQIDADTMFGALLRKT